MLRKSLMNQQYNPGAPDNYCHCIILSPMVCAETNALKHDCTHLLGVHNRLNVYENKESFQQCTWGDTQVWGGKNQFSLEQSVQLRCNVDNQVWGGKNQTQTSHINSKRYFIQHVECNKNKYVEPVQILIYSKRNPKIQIGSNLVTSQIQQQTNKNILQDLNIYMSLPIKSIVAQFTVE